MILTSIDWTNLTNYAQEVISKDRLEITNKCIIVKHKYNTISYEFYKDGVIAKSEIRGTSELTETIFTQIQYDTMYNLIRDLM